MNTDSNKDTLLSIFDVLTTYAWALWADQDEDELAEYLRDPAGYPEYRYVGQMVEEFESSDIPDLIHTYGEPMQQIVDYIQAHHASEEVNKFLVAIEKVIRHR